MKAKGNNTEQLIREKKNIWVRGCETEREKKIRKSRSTFCPCSLGNTADSVAKPHTTAGKITVKKGKENNREEE